jgi:hypothetical protein
VNTKYRYWCIYLFISFCFFCTYWHQFFHSLSFSSI